jgi:hypothetical protein
MHIVLTGHLNSNSARTFLSEFYNPFDGYQVSRWAGEGRRWMVVVDSGGWWW